MTAGEGGTGGDRSAAGTRVETVPARSPAIARLPPRVASQLAAGEVVERPASVVKELVENSLDAGARTVTIELEAGGARRIRVTDDGGGIRRADLALALERHATSKIASVDDLFRVASLGFRGEALASIAAVSRLVLTSRTGGEESGWRLRGDGGDPEPARHPVGTTVDVQDLFHSVPARRRFLRAERTELQHAVDIVRRLALARPDVAFRLVHGGRTAFRARSEEGRLDEALGHGFAAAATPIGAATEGLHLRGWIGVGAVPRQHFFLNGRGVRDRALGHAVRVGLEGRAPPGREVVSVLFLTMDPALVDVNVHPGKHEVRFRQPRTVHDFLVTAVRRAVAGGFDGLGVKEAEPPPYHASVTPPGRLFEPEEADGRGRGASERMPGADERAPTPGEVPSTGPEPAPPSPDRPAAAYRPRPASRPPASGAAGGVGRAREEPVIGWIGGRYAVAALEGRVYLVDFPRALGEAVRGACARASDTRPMRSLPLLVPARVRAPEAALDGFETEALVRYGIVLRRLGPDLASLLEVPRLLRHCVPSTLARSIIEAPAAGLAGVLARSAADAVPAVPAERDSLLRELLARRGEVLGPAVAREIDVHDAERLLAR